MMVERMNKSALTACFDEQVQQRISIGTPAGPEVATAASGPKIDLDPSDEDVWATTKELHKMWTSGVKHNKPQWLAALGEWV